MNIGLVIASFNEIKELFNSNLKLEKEFDNSPFPTYLYKINEHNLYVALSGIGEISSSAATQYLITKFDVKLILNYGVVGALHPNLKLTNTVVVEKIVNPEIDTSTLDNCDKYVYFGYGFDTPYMNCDENLIAKAIEIEPTLTKVTCLSSNKFIESKQEKAQLNKQFNADICEMEAAGIYLTSLKNKIPCLFIKGISDDFNDNSADSFYKMVSQSSKIVLKILLKIIDQL